MMKFATIMREAGFNQKFLELFFSCGLIDTKVYDEEDGVYEENDLKFIKPLFDDNPDSFEKFFDFVSQLDANPDYLSIDIQITPDHVIVFYKTPNARIFRRTPSPDPIGDVD